MVTYEKRNSFLQGLHPLTSTLLLILYLISFIVIENPIYLIFIMLSILTLAYEDGCLKDLIHYGKLIMPFALLIIVLNPLIVHNGDTVIYSGKINYPLVGALRITMEAMLYGVFNGIRIICITITFGFGNLIIHPDRAFSFFSKYIKNSALLMNMTIRLFPTMMNSYRDILDVEKLRGNKILDKSTKKTIVNWGNVVNILFQSSIENSSDMAEAMYARGYGASKNRSIYFYDKFRMVDIIINITVVITLVYLKILQFKGFLKLDFYPKVCNPIKAVTISSMIFCLMLFIPSLVSWGWKNWK